MPKTKIQTLDNVWSNITEDDLDELDAAMLSEIEETKGEQEFIAADEVSRRLKEVRAERKKKGDLHVRIASSLHEEIVDDALDEGISLNQYVATALAYYAGVRRNSRQAKN